MKQVVRLFILTLKYLSRVKIFSGLIYKCVQLFPTDSERKRRVEGYIFGKVALRGHRKKAQRKYKQETRKKRNSKTLNLGPRTLSFRRSIYSLLIRILSNLNRKGFAAPSHLLVWFLEKTKFSDTRVESIRTRVFGKDYVEKVRSKSTDIFDISSVLNPEKSANNLETNLKKFRTLHIFVEGKSSIPEYLTGPEFSHLQFVVYSFSDQSKIIENLGLSDRTRYLPLRDRFNEISPEGVELFEFSRKLADSLMGIVENHQSGAFQELSDRQKEVMSLGLDGRISSRLSIAACYREGISQVPRSEGVLFLALTNNFIVNGWSYFKDIMSGANRFVAFTTPKEAIRRKSMRTFSDLLSGKRTNIDGNSDGEPSGRDLSKVDQIFAGLQRSFEEIEQSGNRLVNALKAKIGEEKPLLIAYAESALNYKVSVEEISKSFLERESLGNSNSLLMLHCSGSPDQFIAPKLEVLDHKQAFVSADLSRLSPLITDHMMTRQDNLILVSWIRAQLKEEKYWSQFDVYPMVSNAIGKFFIEQVQWIVAGYGVGLSLSANVAVESTLALPTRHWLIRSVCAGMLDGPRGTRPLIDVQTLNILKHPKYRAPMANHCSVIDHTAKNIYTSYLGVPETAITVTGAPQNDSLQRNLSLLDQGEIIERFGFDSEAKVIVLISQLQPFERMRRIIRPIGELLRDNKNYECIIRMHPRETMDRRVAYKNELSKFVDKKRIHFSIEDAPLDVLKIADVCVTIYSNMAREAAIAGIPVITVNYLGWEPPIRLDAEGLAKPSPTPKKLKRNIVEALDQQSDGLTHSSSYLALNPHILEGNSVARIFKKATQLNKFEGLITGFKTETVEPHNEFEIDFLNKFEELHLVMSSENRVADLPPIFRKDIDLKVFNSRSDKERGFVPKSTIIESGKYNKENAESVEGAVERGGLWAEKCVDIVSNHLESCCGKRMLLGTIRDSLWLRLRPSFLRAAMELANIERGIVGFEGGLVICSSNDTMLSYLSKRAVALGVDIRKIAVLKLHKNLTYDFLAVTEYLKPSGLAVKSPAKVSQKQKSKTAEFVCNWIDSLEKTKFEMPRAPRLLISSDWALKTVPATLTPVVKELERSKLDIMFANVRADDLERLKQTFETHKNPDKVFSYMIPTDVKGDAIEMNGRHLKNIANIWQNEIFADEEEFPNVPPNVQRLMFKAMDNVARIFLKENLIWAQYCQQWFSASYSASLASPGRQWHSEIAHRMAEKHNRLSMTLQNAYMTKGYTYTKPTGNYITAIDQWSKDVFMEGYDVPEENIHVVSTPRFDYLAELSKLDSTSALKRLNIGNPEKIVFFAAQIGLEEEAEQIVRLLANLEKVGDTAITSLVKLHPRTPHEDIAKYEAYASEENPEHSVIIRSEGDIADFLSASDIVITAYSNVGIEAAILGKPLIVAKLTDAPLPLPMDEFGIGYVARNSQEIGYAITEFLSSDSFYELYAQKQEAYRKVNPAMVNGNSTQIIAEAIDASLKSL